MKKLKVQPPPPGCPVWALAGPEQELLLVHALQVRHGLQVSLLQLLQLPAVFLIGEEDLAEVQPVGHGRAGVAITQSRARVLTPQLQKPKAAVNSSFSNFRFTNSGFRFAWCEQPSLLLSGVRHLHH